MSDTIIKLQEISDLKGQIRKLESMLKPETNTSNEYRQGLQKYVSTDPDVAEMEARSTFGGASHHPMIEQLENELKIQQITNGDLVDEANEYVKEIARLKDEVNPCHRNPLWHPPEPTLTNSSPRSLPRRNLIWWH